MKKIFLIIFAIALIALLAFLFSTMRQDGSVTTGDQNAALGDPMDATLEFYQAWHEAELSTTTDPQTENLLDHPRISEEVRLALTNALNEDDREVNPVLCQTTVPPRIGTKVSYTLDNQAEVHVFARGFEERSSRTAVVELSGDSGEWLITRINCANGEQGPDREFTFAREGSLLKSVPPPLNPEYWHLVFEEDSVNGHTAPLFFDENSTCVMTDGSETQCDPDTFTDATRAFVQGNMTEAGVNVVRVTFLP